MNIKYEIYAKHMDVELPTFIILNVIVVLKIYLVINFFLPRIAGIIYIYIYIIYIMARIYIFNNERFKR